MLQVYIRCFSTGFTTLFGQQTLICNSFFFIAPNLMTHQFSTEPTSNFCPKNLVFSKKNKRSLLEISPKFYTFCSKIEVFSKKKVFSCNQTNISHFFLKNSLCFLKKKSSPQIALTFL